MKFDLLIRYYDDSEIKSVDLHTWWDTVQYLDYLWP